MYQEGEISINECSKCGGQFPVFTFVADTDMVTNGCIALTGQDNSIVLTMGGLNESYDDIEARVASNHKVVKIQFETESSNSNGSFQEFLKTYNPPTPTYTCIYCGGNAKTIKHETKEQFLSYGKIEVVNNDC
jgi:hypothetical protein